PTCHPVAVDPGDRRRPHETAPTPARPSHPFPSRRSSDLLPLPPSNTGLPTISGTAKQGQTLTEVHGTWTNNPTGYTYKWLQCDSARNSRRNISGAEGQTYVPVEGDVANKLRVQQSASNAG